MPWEDFLTTQLPPGSRLPKNYKTFDHYPEFEAKILNEHISAKTAISAKTLNTNTVSRLTDPKKIYYSLKKSIDAAERFVEHRFDRVPLTSEMISSRVVYVAVPESTTSAQWEQILRAVEYGKSQGITLKVMETLK